MNYCSTCGKELKQGAKFCSGCGKKIVVEEKQEITPPPVPNTIKDGEIHKCPSCGEKLPYDALICSRCGYEVRGRKANKSLEEFSQKILLETEESKIIELIKTYPIPNNREDIFEFMVLASSNYDANYYAKNKAPDSVAAAWLVKIEQCYKKAKLMLKDPQDLTSIESLYNGVLNKTKEFQKKRIVFIAVGAILIILSVILMPGSSGSTPLSAITMGILAVGIVFLVLGIRKPKTNAQIAEERVQKESKKETKINEKTELNANTAKVPDRYTIFNSHGRIVNKSTYLFLAIVFGWMGLHRVYGLSLIHI